MLGFTPRDVKCEIYQYPLEKFTGGVIGSIEFTLNQLTTDAKTDNLKTRPKFLRKIYNQAIF